ncbi:MAG: alpha/beta fold hydrolase [Ilumatobacter sp.]|nr:alpha/beta fold hydrolase [Ilumatobacter sp.]
MTRGVGRRGRVAVAAAVLAVAGCSSGDDTSGSTTDAGTAEASSDVGEPVERTDDATEDDRADETAGSGDAPSTDGVGTTDGVSTVSFDPAPIEWQDFNDQVDVATVAVPVDYADREGERFELFLARYRALDPDRRIGSLLVNPGGPGFGGSDFAVFASQIFDQALLERFDIVGWDPRGTGESDPPIDCIDDYDPYYAELDHTPETDAERAAIVAAAEELAQRCVENNSEIIQHVGTNNSARDIDVIRRALGEDQISFFGFSYGSELGAAWATMFPDTVRAAVFDGASDPEADDLGFSLQQQRGFEAAISTFLARCSSDSDCAFHNDGDAEAAFDELMQRLDEDPIDAASGRPPVNRDVALTAVSQAMYREALWPALEQSLAEAADGDGGGLLALHDAYFRRAADGTWPNGLEAHQAISCADEDERKTVEEEDAESPLFTEAAPRMNPAGSIGYFCTFFPPSIDPRVDITGAGAGPIVVIGTTGDPATPFEGTVRMANTLEDGRLVIVEANEHTGYGLNRCVIDVVNDYLIDLVAPLDETECR